MGVPSQEMRSRGVVPDTGCLAKRVDRQGRKEGRNKKHLETVAMRYHERPWDFGIFGVSHDFQTFPFEETVDEIFG